MKQQEQQISFPMIRIYNNYGNVYGLFGNHYIFNLKNAYKSLNDDVFRESGRSVYFKDVCFGPYINFNEIKDFGTRSVDDFLVVCKPDNKITIYDQTTLDNKSRKINWFNDEDKQQPIIFEPQLTLYAAPKKVTDEAKYMSANQTHVETTVFKIMKEMGFDGWSYGTQQRFFKPFTKYEGKKPIKYPDSAFLIKSEKYFYSYFKVYSMDMSFEVSHFYGSELRSRYSIPNIVELVKNLRELRTRRNNYLKRQYGN